MAISYVGLMGREQRIADQKEKDRDRIASLYAALDIAPGSMPTSSSKTGTSSAMAENINILKSLGASDNLIAEANGYDAADLDEVVQDLLKKKDAYAGTRMALGPDKIDSYLSALVKTTTPGTKPNKILLAKQAGIDIDLLDEEVEGMEGVTNWDLISQQLSTQTRTRVANTTSYGKQLSVSDIKGVKEAANNNVEVDLIAMQGRDSEEQRRLIAMDKSSMSRTELEAHNNKIQSLSKRMSQTGRAKDALGRGNAALAIQIVGGESILQEIYNTPNAVYQDFGAYSDALVSYSDWKEKRRLQAMNTTGMSPEELREHKDKIARLNPADVAPRIFDTKDQVKEVVAAGLLFRNDIVLKNGQVGKI